MDELSYNGIALAPVVVALVAVLREYGLPAKFAPLANGVISVLLLALIQYRQGWGTVSGADFTIEAMILFVATAGVYDLGQFSLKQLRKRGA